MRISDWSSDVCSSDLNVEEIATCSPRLECLIFGMGDYSGSQGIDTKSFGSADGYPGDIFHYARWRITMAARSAGIDAVDGPFADFRDEEGYRREAIRSEEHTSELQSLMRISYAVFCLKKKKT